jgi:hypothetical protein
LLAVLSHKAAALQHGSAATPAAHKHSQQHQLYQVLLQRLNCSSSMSRVQ